MFVETGTPLDSIPSIAASDTAAALGRILLQLGRSPLGIFNLPSDLRQLYNDRQLSKMLHARAEEVHAGLDITLPSGGGDIWPTREHLNKDIAALGEINTESLAPSVKAILKRSQTLRNLPDQLASLKQDEAAHNQRKGRLAYVTHVSFPEALSGYTRRSDSILHTLRAQGIDVVHLSSHTFRAKAVRASADLTLVERIKLAAERLANALPKDITCIVAASDWTNGWIARLAAWELNVPFAYEIRGAWELTHTAHNPEYRQYQAFSARYNLEKRLCSVSDMVFVQTAQLASYYDLGSQSALIPNGVEEIVKCDPVTSSTLKLCYAGSLVSYEGLDTALQALKSGGRDDITLKIIGDGPSKAQLERQIKSLGLSDRVSMMGSLPKSQAKAEIKKCDAVILPRQNVEVCQTVEPLKAVESLAFSRPVLATPIKPVNYPGVWTSEDFSAGALSALLDRAARDRDGLILSGKEGQDWVAKSRLWSDVTKPIVDWSKPYLIA